MGNFKGYTNFNKNLGQTAPSAWKCPSTQFWGPLTSWKFEPSPRPHSHSDLASSPGQFFVNITVGEKIRPGIDCMRMRTILAQITLTYSVFPSSCNIRLQEWEPCHPIKLQKDLNSALWLAHTVVTVATGSCKNLEKHCILKVDVWSLTHNTESNPGITV